MTLWTLNIKLLIPEDLCVLINTWIMKLFNGCSHIISDDYRRRVLLLTSNLYLSDVEVRLINLTFLAPTFSSFNVRIPSKNFYNFRQYGQLMNVMNTGNCSCLRPIVDCLFWVLARRRNVVDLDKTYLKVCQAPGCQDILSLCLGPGCCHSHWAQILQTIKHKARRGLEPRPGQ